jgi:hypothetical protein
VRVNGYLSQLNANVPLYQLVDLACGNGGVPKLWRCF